MIENVARAEGLTAVLYAPGGLAHPECADGPPVDVTEPGQRCEVCKGTITATSDMANLLLMDGYTSTQKGPKRGDCYICQDPEFSRMGLPLCTACPKCGGHVAADDTVCDDCGYDAEEDME